MRLNFLLKVQSKPTHFVGVVTRERKAPGVKGTEGLTCAREGIRTPNLLIRSQMLYPLSYARFFNFVQPAHLTFFS